MFAGQFYGSGETWSQDASDQMLLGPYHVNQSFWEVSKAKMPVLLASEFHAIIGLGPPETPAKDAWEAAARSAHNVSEVLSTVGEVDNATLQLARDKARIAVAMGKRSTALKTMNENMFSVCIGKDPGSEGVLIWNDTSAALYPQLFHKVPVIGRNSWSVKAHNARLAYVKNTTESHPIDGPEADGEEESFQNSTSINLGCEDGCGVLLDSGTSLLAVPHTVINRLVQLIASPNLNCSNMWELPHLVFDLNGKTFSLPPDVYVSEVSYAVPSYMQSFVRLRHLGTEAQRPGRRCDLLVMESYAKSDAGPLWIFGMPFFPEVLHLLRRRAERLRARPPPGWQQPSLYADEEARRGARRAPRHVEADHRPHTAVDAVVGAAGSDDAVRAPVSAQAARRRRDEACKKRF
jgi:hypothetical protein